ncbi:MAG: class I SAM-dependent methyltransferase [Candidatus Omnitrophica bacterium]|nr:class I SAM-dependent methyltransferase [Candidatus Omnitrophota bacterium]
MFSIYDSDYFDEITLSVPGYREVTDRLYQNIEKKPYCTVLDIGTGTGEIALKLAGSVFRVVAVDNSKDMLRKICGKTMRKSINNIRIIERDITDRAFLWPNTDPVLLDCMFTSVVCCFVLHHLRDRWKKIVLEQLRKSLKPGGKIIIADMKPEKAWQIRKQANAVYWRLVRERENRYPVWSAVKSVLSCLFFEHSLSPEAWEELLKEAGYKDARKEAIGDFTLISANCRRQGSDS